jgi:hypothetical protein
MGWRLPVMVLTAASVGGSQPAARAAASEVRETVAGVQQLFEPLGRLQMRLDVGLATSVVGPGSRAGAALEVALRPDRWYAVGVAVLSPPDPDVTTTVTTSSGGTSVATTRQQGDTVALSARIFKRLGPAVVSAGIIDNHGGVGLELRGLGDRLRLEALVSSAGAWRSSAVVNLRVGGSAQWRWLYVQAGVWDILDPSLRAAYVGIGMRWSDPDLKYVLPWATRL